MWALIVRFFHESITDFASKHFNIFITGFIAAQRFNFAVFGTEQLQFSCKIETFQGDLGFDSMLERLCKVFRSIENSPVVNISDVNSQDIVLDFCLRSLNGDTSLTSNTANGDFAHPAQKCLIRCILRRLTQGARNDVLGRVRGVSAS